MITTWLLVSNGNHSDNDTGSSTFTSYNARHDSSDEIIANSPNRSSVDLTRAATALSSLPSWQSPVLPPALPYLLPNRCRLLALVLCENPSSLDQDLRNTLMDHLLALLLSSINPEHPPQWLAAHLLVTEALLTLSDEPRTISLPKEDEPIEISSIPVGPP